MPANQSGLLGILGNYYQGLIQRVQGLGQGSQHQQRLTDDHYVTGGTNWNGYSLETLIKFVATQANPAQLEFLADTWRRQGDKLSSSADNLQQSLVRLMQFWGGAGSEEATRTVARNASWIQSLGQTSSQIAEPVDDSGGALRSAQSTMPGAPKGGFWSGLGTAGGAAAAGFAIGGPFGAAAGAVLGGIASAFGFGNSKKKLKKKAVQTMSRYETAILGIDRATPQFNQPQDGIVDPIWNRPTPPPGVGVLPPGYTIPGVGGPMPGPRDPGAGPGTLPGIGTLPGMGTTPSFADNPSARWNSLTGAGPYGGMGPGGGAGFGLGATEDMAARNSRLLAAGGAGAFGAGAMPPMMGAGGGRGMDIERGASRYGKAGGASGYGPGGMGAGANKEEDQEHKRRFPVEEDLFTGDLKAAPPVIGL
ncbi:hypothetical protein [Actinocrispum sp. NPDC049592]|uniref:hypothetical protein n=1 Tax=Actinocrispum sp. NPDC049592 TaxID=3154835 RepID=UPI00343C1D04